MIVVNLSGGPCSGKSTSSSAIFAYLKNRGVRAELVHEAAKRFIYKGASVQLKNQLYVIAKQYAAIVDLEREGCEVAISDSPLICNLMYSEDTSYFAELEALALKIDREWAQYNIFVERTKNYDGFGRMQKTLEEAAVFDVKVKLLMEKYGKHFDLSATGDEEGQRYMGANVFQMQEALNG